MNGKLTEKEWKAAKDEFTEFKWLSNTMANVKRLPILRCGSCGNRVTVKEKFEGYGWIETKEYCKLKIVPDSSHDCKSYDSYGKPKVKYVREKK